VGRIWDSADGRLLIDTMKHADTIEAANWSSGGDRIITGSGDKTARVWDARTGEPVTPPLVQDGAVKSVRFSRDARRVVTLCEGSRVRRWNVQVWDVETGTPYGAPLTDLNGLPDAQFTPDGTQVLVANASFYDPVAGQLSRTLPV